MSDAIKKFVADDEGATAVEYGLMVGLIAVVDHRHRRALGAKLDGVFATRGRAGAAVI